jgi:hypothetical protein
MQYRIQQHQSIFNSPRTPRPSSLTLLCSSIYTLGILTAGFLNFLHQTASGTLGI